MRVPLQQLLDDAWRGRVTDPGVAVAERLGLDRRHSTSYVEQLRSPAADGGA
jgi:hypothetical protein